jgi:hypothetical protein
MGSADRIGSDNLYMQRWLIELGPRRRSFRLHIIHAPDSDNCLHDHPWSFKSIIVKGGYDEEVPAPDSTLREAQQGYPRRVVNVVRPFRFRSMPLNYKHRIVRLHKKISITIAYAGPLSQDWGFWTRHGKIFWWEFVEKDHPTRVLWCEHDA